MATAEVATVEQQRPAPRVVAPVHLRMGAVPQGGMAGLFSGTLGVIEGRPGSWGQVALGTVLRAAIIAPCFYFTGTKDWKRVAIGSAAASATLTVLLLAGHAVQRATHPAQ